MEFRTLENTDILDIYKVFLKVFSDYQVSVAMPFEAFGTMLKRNGFTPDVSVGAFENGKLLGFVLNAVRVRQGVKTIYDLGTGVIPDFRRTGITSGLLELVNALCESDGIAEYRLEVIQENMNAVTLYQRQGFQVDRNLNCYCLQEKIAEKKGPNRWKILHPETMEAGRWCAAESFWNYAPSWQNTVDSICAADGSFCYTVAELDGELIGYGIIGKTNGDIVQLAVNPVYRRMGVATEILYDLQSRTSGARLKVSNVDSRDETTDAFLKNMGFLVFLKQYEMKKRLSKRENESGMASNADQSTL